MYVLQFHFFAFCSRLTNMDISVNRQQTLFFRWFVFKICTYNKKSCSRLTSKVFVQKIVKRCMFLVKKLIKSFQQSYVVFCHFVETLHYIFPCCLLLGSKYRLLFVVPKILENVKKSTPKMTGEHFFLVRFGEG